MLLCPQCHKHNAQVWGVQTTICKHCIKMRDEARNHPGMTEVWVKWNGGRYLTKDEADWLAENSDAFSEVD